MTSPSSLSQALAVAIQAAQDAGALLRAELHRPGGPRGQANHAEADREAEALIRSRIGQAFPHHSLVGEELGRTLGSHGATPSPIWLIDPNDGTSAFVRGCRGSSVSIALLTDGIPVLGVVNVFAAPDDDGELFSWAKGCGPLSVNGVPVARSSWAESPNERQIVLAPMNGDAKSEALAKLIAPSRFRCIPSIATRLAYVAVGRAEAAFSLSGPVHWDFAGGHALLMGVGGDLVDSAGLPIRYTTAGEAHAETVIGGGGGTLRAFAAKDWDGLAVAPRSTARQTIQPRRLECNAGVLSRAQGCLLGQLASDSLGALVEFDSPASIAARYPQGVRDLRDGGPWQILAGQPTDDSELALALALSIARKGAFDVEDVAASYSQWIASAPFDIGSTTRRALGPGWQALQAGQPVARACESAANRESEANGALMRVSPLGIHGARLGPEVLATMAMADAALTHPNPICQHASAVFACTLGASIRQALAPCEAHGFALKLADRLSVDPRLRQALLEARHRPPRDYMTQQGWVLVAMQNAYYRLLHARNLEEGVVATIMAGGDTDTNACIAGALLGAVHGREAIPQRWQDAVLSCRPIACLPTVRQPRPPDFWPTHALPLAEALLQVG